MRKIKHLLVISMAFAFLAIPLSAAAQSSQNSESALMNQVKNLRTWAKTYGVQLESLTIRRNDTRQLVGKSTENATTTSAAGCTATATATVGGTKMTITATAPTCTQAVSMVMQGLKTAEAG